MFFRKVRRATVPLLQNLVQGFVFLGTCIGLSSLSPAQQDQVVIYLIDRSHSMNHFEPPHNQEAVVNHAIDMSRLTGGSVKLAFVFFNSDRVQVEAGQDGLPAPGSAEMRLRCQKILRKPCAGATPLDEALQIANKMLAECPSANKTLVIISDGDPSANLRPDLFGAVKEAIAKEEAKRVAEGGRDAVEAFQAKLEDMQSAEFKALYAIQQPLLFARCIQLAQQTNHLKARVVSLAFCPSLEKFHSIHVACGGAESDYVELDPGAVLQKIHDIQLFDGVLAFPVIDAPAVDEFESQIEFNLSGELEAKSLIVVEFVATPDIDSHAELEFEVDRQSFRHSREATDESLVISRDAKQRLATIAVISDPAKTGLFRFVSPNQDLGFPGAKIYRYIETPENLRFVCHPISTSAAETTGFRVNERSDEAWLCGLQWSDDRTIPLKSADVIFRNQNNNRDYLVTLKRDDRFQNRFKIDPPPQFVIGKYDVFLNFELESGLAFATRIESHFEVVGVEETVRLEISSDSIAFDGIDFGELGDDVLKKTIKVTLHSATPHDLVLRIRLVGLKDTAGTVTGSDWIVPSDPAVKLPAGKFVAIGFTCAVPEEIPDELTDGLLTAALEIVNAETLESVDVEPLIEGTADTESLQLIRMTLRRPHIIVSAPYAGREWLQGDGQTRHLDLSANVSMPFSRLAKLEISTDSKVDREVSVRVSRLRTAQGAAQSTIDLKPDENWSRPVSIPAGTTVKCKLRLEIDDLTNQEFDRAKGQIVVSAKGMKPIVIETSAGAGVPWGKTIRCAFFVVAIVAMLVIARAMWRLRHAARFAPRKTSTRFRAGTPVFDLFHFRPSDDQLLISPMSTDLAVEDEEGEFMPQKTQFHIDVDTRNLRMNCGKEMEIEIEKIDKSGQPLWARVKRAKKYDRIRGRAKAIRTLSFFVAATAISLALLMYSWPPATRFVQFMLDACRLT